MKHRRFRLSLILALSGIASLYSQGDTGTITGTVTDPTGAAVPNVQISLIQIQTNFRFSSSTNSQGIYRVASLPPGIYRITFEAGGFKRLVREEVAIRVGDVLPVDAPMEVGTATESVQVTAEGTLLETETSSLGTVTEGDTLYKLALYQRYVNNSLSITPGMTEQGYTYGATLGGFSVAGQRPTGTAMFEDGVFGNHPQSSTTTTIQPIENAVGEVKVLIGTLPGHPKHQPAAHAGIQRQWTGYRVFHSRARRRRGVRSDSDRPFHQHRGNRLLPR